MYRRGRVIDHHSRMVIEVKNIKPIAFLARRRRVANESFG